MPPLRVGARQQLLARSGVDKSEPADSLSQGDTHMGRILSLSRAAVFAGLLGASLLGTSAQAQAYGGCRERIRRAEIRLHEAANRHGWNSRQARARQR